jgi:EAL domain-containing protein (putative c-di-GMP-specific phosphodiesterase class I)
VTAVEALLRWQHPERGLLGPHLFLPAAEQSGLIERLTAWVVERALTDRAVWTSQGRPWAVAVNVSARNLESPTLVGHVARLLASTGTPPDQLYLEVTETAIAGDPVVAVATVQALAETGVRISLDDFGVGYTSLSQLRSLPVAELKIDRAFVTALPAPDSDRAIVAAVVQLAHGLGCTVTAEGVETAEAAAWLRAAGCDSAQGYHFARPAPWTELREAELPARDDLPSPLPSVLPPLPRPSVPTEELAAP